MVALAQPHLRFHRSYLTASDEFAARGEQQHGGILVWPADDQFPGVEFSREGLEDQAEFRCFVDNRIRDALPDSPRPTGWVPCTYLWMADGDEFLGSIALRHSIDNPLLAEVGGHIGYSVRPSARRRGHATDALRQVVALAGQMGLDRVLVTCDLDNVASARTIESGRGVYESSRSGKRRYWIATG
jgi:predicted acetyltransferase